METAGAYTAAVTNPAGTILVSSVMVTPPVPVEVTALQLPSSPPCLLNGTSVIIRCINNGFPRPDITFSRGTLDITPGGRFQQLRFDTLNLTMVQQEDEAEYVCRASRGGTELARSPSLRLEFCTLPTVVRLDMPMVHTEGAMFQLVCSFSAIPSPMIRWEKDGELFLLGEGRRIINSTVTDGMGQSQLDIISLVLGDTGVYTCMVSNPAGMATRSVRLEVGGPTTLPTLTTTERDILPTITDLEMPMTHTEGDRLELVCSFVAIPALSVRWEKDGELFLLGEGRRINDSMIVNGTGQSQLQIDSLVRSDAGIYTCIVTSPIGPAMRSVRLKVRAAGLSPGAIVGIVIGATVGLAVIVILILVIIFRTYVKGKGASAASHIPLDKYTSQKTPLDDSL